MSLGLIAKKRTLKIELSDPKSGITESWLSKQLSGFHERRS